MKSDKQNGTFDFLGFTHFWAKSRKGFWVIKRKTCKKRFKRTMKSLWSWCRYNRHEPALDQYKTLCTKLRGHFQYYGVRGNYLQLELVLKHAEKAWRYWLGRRSRTSYISWKTFERMKLVFPLARPRIYHYI